MKRHCTVAAAVAIAWLAWQGNANAENAKALNFNMKTLEGKDAALSKYQGKVVLLVNVASKCGLTPQYEQLQALHKKYAKQGLAVVGIPCNQFGKQEPGTEAEIREFCTTNYGVEFDLLEKVEVNGENACPLYKHLTQLDTTPKGPGKIAWNFEKFLIDRKGAVVARFEPRTEPLAPEVIELIETKIAESPTPTVGDKAPNFTAKGVDDKEYSLESLEKKSDLVVVCFTCNKCPVAAAYEDRFIAFNRKYEDKKVSFIAVNCNNKTENLDVMKQRAEEKGFNFVYAFDGTGDAARKYGARVTPEMFVIKDGRIAYHGAYDDKMKGPTKTYLVSAVDALLSGQTPEASKTKAFGCGIKLK